MANKSLFSKFLLVILSIFLSLVIIEFVLRLGGFLFLFSQDRANQKGLIEDGLFVIMCLGESTTALGDEYSYPAQLEKILNERIKNPKVKVINKGIPAINMVYILEHLDENIKKYRPNLVITMMGVNDESEDYSYRYVEESERDDNPVRPALGWYDSFRVVKLFKLIRKHLVYKMKDVGWQDLFLDDSLKEVHPEKILQILERYRKTRKALEGQKARSAAMPPKAKENLEKDLAEIKNLEYYFLILAGRWYFQEKNLEVSRDYFREAIALMPDEGNAYIQLGRLLR